MQKLKVDPAPNERIEDGAIEFEYPNGRKDWPGLYLRGDTYIGIHSYTMAIDYWIKNGKKLEEFPRLEWECLKGLISDSEVLVTFK